MKRNQELDHEELGIGLNPKVIRMIEGIYQ